MDDIKKDINDAFDLFLRRMTDIEIKYDAIINGKKKKVENKRTPKEIPWATKIISKKKNT